MCMYSSVVIILFKVINCFSSQFFRGYHFSIIRLHLVKIVPLISLKRSHRIQGLHPLLNIYGHIISPIHRVRIKHHQPPTHPI
jgi:hypothetical protein